MLAGSVKLVLDASDVILAVRFRSESCRASADEISASTSDPAWSNNYKRVNDESQ
jgi:hypothetical protein